MDIDNNILALSMEFERQNMVVTEWESERARRLKGRQEPTQGPNGEEIIDMDTDKEKGEGLQSPHSHAFPNILFGMRIYIYVHTYIHIHMYTYNFSVPHEIRGVNVFSSQQTKTATTTSLRR